MERIAAKYINIVARLVLLEKMTLLDHPESRSKRAMRNNHGFTLMELMVSTAIFAIIAAIAIGNFLSSRPQRQLQSAARQLYADVQKGKLTAIKEHTFCSLSLNVNVDGTTWDYLIYTDGDKSQTYTAGDRIIARGRWASYPYVSLQNETLSDDTITFRSTGMTTKPSGGFATGTISIRNTKGESRSLTISQAGNIRLTAS